jgi:hypothetical protein
MNNMKHKGVVENMSTRLSEEIERKIKRRAGVVLKKLVRRHLYPLVHPSIKGSCVKISCVSPYYDGKLKWFQNYPKTEEDWKLMEEYAWLEHALVCPRPYECPTVRKLRKRWTEEF